MTESKKGSSAVGFRIKYAFHKSQWFTILKISGIASQ